MVVGMVSWVSRALKTGPLARRFGEARVLAFGMGLFGSSLFFQVIAPQPIMVPIIMAFGAFGMSLAMPNISALISRSTSPDKQGAMLGLNMAAGSLARMVGPVAAGFTYSGLGHDAPFLTGALLVIPAVWLALDTGRVFHRLQASARAGAATEPRADVALKSG